MVEPRPRFHVVSGLALPLVALTRMVRDPQGRAPVLLVFSLFIIGTIFYTLAENWSVVDSFYFSTMTLATVGFGDSRSSAASGSSSHSFFTELSRWSLELRAQFRGEESPDSAGAGLPR